MLKKQSRDHIRSAPGLLIPAPNRQHANINQIAPAILVSDPDSDPDPDFDLVGYATAFF
jgi:hypothetical protein